MFLLEKHQETRKIILSAGSGVVFLQAELDIGNNSLLPELLYESDLLLFLNMTINLKNFTHQEDLPLVITFKK